MICNVCGKPQPCIHSVRTAAVLAQVDSRSKRNETESPDTDAVALAITNEGVPSVSLDGLAAQVRANSDQRSWREEVAIRVNRHRARRGRTDESSLRLDFPAEEALPISSTSAQQRAYPPQESWIAMAHESKREKAQEEKERDSSAETRAGSDSGEAVLLGRPRKVIRFPRNSHFELPAIQTPRITEIELAEPAPEAPRIMEAPPAEQMELLPSFTDMHLDEAPRENFPGSDLELPLHPASVAMRMFSALADAAIVLLGLGLFAFSFTKVAPAQPPGRAELLSMLVAALILWLVFQYVFLVYGKRTPGMQAAQLQLFTFEGGRASLAARRSRALASALCAISVGLGFAWALVDEDTLGWHDRISRTYLKSSGRLPSAISREPYRVE